MSKQDSRSSLFSDPDPEEQRFEHKEYWYWSDDATVGEMTVTRDGLGRFVEFLHYEPRVIHGQPTEVEKRKQSDNITALFE